MTLMDTWQETLSSRCSRDASSNGAPVATYAARYGGEEFAIILSGSSMEEVVHQGRRAAIDPSAIKRLLIST